MPPTAILGLSRRLSAHPDDLRAFRDRALRRLLADTARRGTVVPVT